MDLAAALSNLRATADRAGVRWEDVTAIAVGRYTCGPALAGADAETRTLAAGMALTELLGVRVVDGSGALRGGAGARTTLCGGAAVPSSQLLNESKTRLLGIMLLQLVAAAEATLADFPGIGILKSLAGDRNGVRRISALIDTIKDAAARNPSFLLKLFNYNVAPPAGVIPNQLEKFATALGWCAPGTEVNADVATALGVPATELTVTQCLRVAFGDGGGVPPTTLQALVQSLRAVFVQTIQAALRVTVSPAAAASSSSSSSSSSSWSSSSAASAAAGAQSSYAYYAALVGSLVVLGYSSTSPRNRTVIRGWLSDASSAAVQALKSAVARAWDAAVSTNAPQVPLEAAAEIGAQLMASPAASAALGAAMAACDIDATADALADDALEALVVAEPAPSTASSAAAQPRAAARARRGAPAPRAPSADAPRPRRGGAKAAKEPVEKKVARKLKQTAATKRAATVARKRATEQIAQAVMQEAVEDAAIAEAAHGPRTLRRMRREAATRVRGGAAASAAWPEARARELADFARRSRDALLRYERALASGDARAPKLLFVPSWLRKGVAPTPRQLEWALTVAAALRVHAVHGSEANVALLVPPAYESGTTLPTTASLRGGADGSGMLSAPCVAAVKTIGKALLATALVYGTRKLNDPLEWYEFKTAVQDAYDGLIGYETIEGEVVGGPLTPYLGVLRFLWDYKLPMSLVGVAITAQSRPNTAAEDAAGPEARGVVAALGSIAYDSGAAVVSALAGIKGLLGCSRPARPGASAADRIEAPPRAPMSLVDQMQRLQLEVDQCAPGTSLEEQEAFAAAKANLARDLEGAMESAVQASPRLPRGASPPTPAAAQQAASTSRMAAAAKAVLSLVEEAVFLLPTTAACAAEVAASYRVSRQDAERLKQLAEAAGRAAREASRELSESGAVEPLARSMERASQDPTAQAEAAAELASSRAAAAARARADIAAARASLAKSAELRRAASLSTVSEADDDEDDESDEEDDGDSMAEGAAAEEVAFAQSAQASAEARARDVARAMESMRTPSYPPPQTASARSVGAQGSRVSAGVGPTPRRTTPGGTTPRRTPAAVTASLTRAAADATAKLTTLMAREAALDAKETQQAAAAAAAAAVVESASAAAAAAPPGGLMGPTASSAASPAAEADILPPPSTPVAQQIRAAQDATRDALSARPDAIVGALLDAQDRVRAAEAARVNEAARKVAEQAEASGLAAAAVAPLSLPTPGPIQRQIAAPSPAPRDATAALWEARRSSAQPTPTAAAAGSFFPVPRRMPTKVAEDAPEVKPRAMSREVKALLRDDVLEEHTGPLTRRASSLRTPAQLDAPLLRRARTSATKATSPPPPKARRAAAQRVPCDVACAAVAQRKPVNPTTGRAIKRGGPTWRALYEACEEC